MDELIKPIEPEPKTEDKKNNTAYGIYFLAVIVLLVGAWANYEYFFADKNTQFFITDAEKIHSQSEVLVPRRLDGMPVAVERKNNLPIAVIIENFFDARPQAGLSQASLVYEAEAEGKITRFLAVFDAGADIEKIGPIRSARPYFVDWAGELGALFVHCGGSPEALVKIKQEQIFNLNEFYNGSYFWRDAGRKSPHNVFTSIEKLRSFLEKAEYDSPNYASWKYQEETQESQRPADSQISIIYSQPHFVVQWNYSKVSNNYLRFQAGTPHQDAEGRQIIAKNVVIAYMANEIIDKDLRLKLENSGRGEAVICRNGLCEKGGWSKLPEKRFTFQDQAGYEINLNRGTTWIEIVSNNNIVSY